MLRHCGSTRASAGSACRGHSQGAVVRQRRAGPPPGAPPHSATERHCADTARPTLPPARHCAACERLGTAGHSPGVAPQEFHSAQALLGAAVRCPDCSHAASSAWELAPCSSRQEAARALDPQTLLALAEAFSRKLLGAGGVDPEGFEDDPITYVEVGCSWPSGRPRHSIEAQLSRRIAAVFAEDARRLAEAGRRSREARSSEAVATWTRRKRTEARARPQSQADQETPARAKHSAEELDAHYRTWCQRYDARRTTQPCTPCR